MTTTSGRLPDSWWEVVEVTASVASLGGSGDYSAMLKVWRKSKIGRGQDLRARDFDNAVSGAVKAAAGLPESLPSLLARSRWYASQGIVAVFARPVGWEWQPEELTAIRIIRATMEPRFLAYDESGIDEIEGPATKPNPWDRWR